MVAVPSTVLWVLGFLILGLLVAVGKLVLFDIPVLKCEMKILKSEIDFLKK